MNLYHLIIKKMLLNKINSLKDKININKTGESTCTNAIISQNIIPSKNRIIEHKNAEKYSQSENNNIIYALSLNDKIVTKNGQKCVQRDPRKRRRKHFICKSSSDINLNLFTLTRKEFFNKFIPIADNFRIKENLNIHRMILSLKRNLLRSYNLIKDNSLVQINYDVNNFYFKHWNDLGEYHERLLSIKNDLIYYTNKMTINDGLMDRIIILDIFNAFILLLTSAKHFASKFYSLVTIESNSIINDYLFSIENDLVRSKLINRLNQSKLISLERVNQSYVNYCEFTKKIKKLLQINQRLIGGK